MPGHSRPTRPPEPPPAEVRCPACGQNVPGSEAVVCAGCGRRVCVRCIRPYGHFMRVCDDCRLGEWR